MFLKLTKLIDFLIENERVVTLHNRKQPFLNPDKIAEDSKNASPCLSQKQLMLFLMSSSVDDCMSKFYANEKNLFCDKPSHRRKVLW